MLRPSGARLLACHPLRIRALAQRPAVVRVAHRRIAVSHRPRICWFLGGHTAEMMNVVTAVQKDRFTPRYYVAALTDNMSLQKAQVYEQSLIQSGEKTIKNAHFVQIYRSREVGQSYFTSIATTLLATLHAMWLVIRIRPQVIFCNGPGTCFPLCVCAFVLKVLGLGWSSIFYIESIARVKKLSLSGLLLYKLRIADQFFVQWPQLQQKYPRAYYAGRLM
uniref:UDP-N-acetylglucosamine transferase subunit ALG14 n=1 Tax=Setaria viridis TaxID=4556 RepID=A0A4U6WEC2_SETVI|nr:hypothetical protein SEVIR_1G224700v2 [Setaria viridis]